MCEADKIVWGTIIHNTTANAFQGRVQKGISSSFNQTKYEQ